MEEIAHALFKTGVEIENNYQKGAAETANAIKNDAEVIYQATVITDKYLCRADILIKDETQNGWHLYEVKSATKVAPEHIADISFQKHLFDLNGIKILTCNIILVNNEYIYDKSKGIEPEKFLTIQDLTATIDQKLPEFIPQFEKAHRILTDPKEPRVKPLLKTFKYPQPQKFLDYYYKGLPPYNIYEISGIRKNNLKRLCDAGITKIEDIPEDFLTSETQNMQVTLTKKKTDFIDIDNIQNELKSLNYPLYFLDYETISTAIPIFDGTKPYQKIPVQYSLHILSEDGALKHHEFLHTDSNNPMPPLLKNLTSQIKSTGNVIVWNASFEKGCNSAMAESNPEHKGFLESVNERIYDLREIFRHDYLDWRFKGSSSIKKVIPVLIPSLSYDDLDIQEGGTASETILNLIKGDSDLKKNSEKNISTALKEYCKRDTLTMVEIFKILQKL